jgi:arylformamidase
MRKAVFLAIAALIAVPPIAAAQDRLDPSCRREVVKLCGIKREEMLSCLKTKIDQLSPPCKSAIEERAAARIMDRGKQAGNGEKAKIPASATEYHYGSDPAQALDFTPAAGNTKAPLVLFIHGGGWSVGNKRSGAEGKAEYYNGLGYAFTSINYRLVPQVKPGEQAQDIAAAIAYLRKNAGPLGFDHDRIVIMGHSAGAHLAALTASDTHYLGDAGVPLSSIRGAVLLDGAGYNVSEQMSYPGNKLPKVYVDAFSSDPATQKALSPVTYVGAPNVANWLILHVESRKDSGMQSRELSAGLTKNGAVTKVVPIPNSTHMSVNVDAGKAGTFVGNQIAAFLKATL